MHQDHIKALDGLRGVAALIVVFSHFSGLTGWLGHWPNHEAAHIGVMIFFCLSGFLMGHLNLERRPTAGAIATFWRRRAARILPLYLLVVGGCYALYLSGVPWQWRAYSVTSENIWQHLLFIDGVHVLWTIPVEIQFYLLFPVFWLAASRLGTWRWLVPLACLLAYKASPSFFWQTTNAVVFKNVFGFFMAGLLGAALLPLARRIPARHWNAIFALCGIGVVLLYPKIYTALTGEMTGFPPAAISYTIYNSELYLGMTALLVFSAALSPWAASALGNRPMAWLGQISFSLYLLHMPVLWALNRFTSAGEHTWLFLVVALPAILLLSSASYRILETPARALVSGQVKVWKPSKSTFTRKSSAPAPVLVTRADRTPPTSATARVATPDPKLVSSALVSVEPSQ